MGLDAAALEVLRRYPPELARGQLQALGGHGGFSGARLWRLQGDLHSCCLRAWPPATQGLGFIHGAMQRARNAGLVIVPALFRTAAGDTAVVHADRLWDLTEWMPGSADFHAAPSGARVQAACTALALLHRAWSSDQIGRCPAVLRRLIAFDDWRDFRNRGWHVTPADSPNDPVFPIAERGWRALCRHMEDVSRRLVPWMNRPPLPLQFCLCDVWHDHVLFEGDRVSGLIDYGSVKVDAVSVDLARMLGSLVGDDAALWAVGLRAYARMRPLSEADERLARDLDRTGTLIGIFNWLKWLYDEGRPFEDRQAVARRLDELVSRVERWAEV